MKLGAWGLGLGAWSLEPGAWSLELGASSSELGAWSLELGAWSLELGARSLNTLAPSNRTAAQLPIVRDQNITPRNGCSIFQTTDHVSLSNGTPQRHSIAPRAVGLLSRVLASRGLYGQYIRTVLDCQPEPMFDYSPHDQLRAVSSRDSIRTQHFMTTCHETLAAALKSSSNVLANRCTMSDSATMIPISRFSSSEV